MPRDSAAIDVAITVSIGHEGSEACLRCWCATSQKKAEVEAKIHYQALYDQLTALPDCTFLNTYLPN